VKGLATATQITKLDGIEAAADVTDATNVAAAGAVMDGDFAANGSMERTGAGTYTTVLNKRDATVAPTANEDSGDGYAIGSRWLDITADKEYICLDATPTAAVWKETTIVAGSVVGHTHTGSPESKLVQANTHETPDTDSATTALHHTLGTGANQAAAGNDSRLSDARTPTSHASSHNAGGGDALAIDAVAGTGSLRTLGTSATSAAAGNDSRLSDARTPTAHAATHTNGTDDIQDATASVKGLATSTQITKLDGIETAADVTDATNVAAAGAVMDGDFAANGAMERTGAGTYTTILNKRDATVAPTANEDSGDGYAIGSRWVDITADKEYVCLDATPTAAVWKETTVASGAPAAHAASHTNGSDDIQDATASVKGLATATQITKLDGIEAAADVTDATNVAAAGAVMDGDFAANGAMERTGAGTYTTILNKRDATVAPTVNEDSGDGYAIGSRWVDVTADKEYICLDATVGAAVWKETTATGGSTALTLNEPAGDNSAGTQSIFDSATVGESVAFPNLLYQKSDGKWWKADADAGFLPALRLALETKSADQTCSMLVQGRVQLTDATSFTVGNLLYASVAAGAIAVLKPDNGKAQIIGVTYHAKKFVFMPQAFMVDRQDYNDAITTILTEPQADNSVGIGSIQDYAQVGESVAFPFLLYQKSDGKWWKADADAATTMPGLRMALESKSADAYCLMLVMGRVRDDDWAWTVGGLIYASTSAGGLTQTAPSGTGDQVQIVGHAYHADKMVFDPSPVIAEVV